MKIEYKLVPIEQKFIFFRDIYKYAAIIFLLLFLGISGYYVSTNTHLFYINHEIPLMSNGAMLILADGKEISLSSDSSFVADNCLIKVNKEEDIIYYSKDLNNSSKYSDDSKFNIIRTDVGKYFKISLPDGTVAHLNSGSSLKFPVNFSNHNRIVEAYGEIYFDVFRDERKPFIVKTEDISVEVLGTKFNLNAYSNSDEVYTTLISGSLKIINKDVSVIISPNQQAICNKSSNEIDVMKVDAEIFSLWTEGSFSFRNERFINIIKTLQRWYDFDYEFNDEECKNIRMGINLSRENDFSDIIESLNNSGLFKLRQRGRTIIIETKKE